MKTCSYFTVLLLFFFVSQSLLGQENYEDQIAELKEQKERVEQQEKEALKIEVEEINKRLENENITAEEADTLKEKAAQKRALNIENRISIIDNKIELLARNEGNIMDDPDDKSIIDDGVGVTVNIGDEPWDPFDDDKKSLRYDRRTYSDFVMAVGLNNVIIEGESINNSPYETAGSRFFEMGWSWRTRVFTRSNFMRFNYGLSFQFNGLKSKNNQYYVIVDGEAVQAEFEYPLRKSKLRMDNLVIPLYLEFGPSLVEKTENRIRYSLRNQFRIGLGGYGGINLGTRQKLKYTRDGKNVKDKLIGGYNTNSFIYGLAGYVGIDCVLLYVKYDLNPIFANSTVEQRNISFGFRFDL